MNDPVPLFDTNRHARALVEKGGFSRPQADAITDADVSATSKLITKKDLCASQDKQTKTILLAIFAMLGALFGLLTLTLSD